MGDLALGAAILSSFSLASVNPNPLLGSSLDVCYEVRQPEICRDPSFGYWLKPLRQLRVAAMTRIGLLRFSISAIAVAFSLTGSAAQSGQQIPGLLGIFTGLMNTAIVDAARRDWQTRPFSDYNCLAKHGVSADQLANLGIGPEDPRARQMLSECAFAAPAAAPVLAAPVPVAPVLAAPVPIAPQAAKDAIGAPPNPNFVVNGLALGASFGAPAEAAVGYACHPSDDYPGFAWCQSHHAETRRFGPETIWMSVF